jgi:hypothetical protein
MGSQVTPGRSHHDIRERDDERVTISPAFHSILTVTRRRPYASVPLILSTRHKLNGLNVKHLSPVRLVYKHPFEHRLGFDTGLEELENLLDLVTDDGVEDHESDDTMATQPRLRPFGRVASTLSQVNPPPLLLGEHEASLALPLEQPSTTAGVCGRCCAEVTLSVETRRAACLSREQTALSGGVGLSRPCVCASLGPQERDRREAKGSRPRWLLATC